ncbi:MAG: phosphoribosyltransferase [Verrucomicrobia subdivision 3 bacterium]|nr:phosphoribosyltransferase [Limisphaerales bacterium]
MTRFQDRFDAGRFLAEKLKHHAGDPRLVVLALPRGGVPVAYEIARALGAPLDVFIVRKLGAPGYEELAMGAIATGGVCVFNEEVIQHLGVSRNWIDAVIREQQEELERREQAYRDGRQPAEVENRHVILVDDGLATGASMRAAIRALRQRHPASITVAVPIGARDTCDQFRNEAEEVICGRTPEPFHAVGAWYHDFTQTTDDEVRELLNRAAHELRIRRVRDHNPAAEFIGLKRE